MKRSKLFVFRGGKIELVSLNGVYINGLCDIGNINFINWDGRVNKLKFYRLDGYRYVTRLHSHGHLFFKYKRS